MSARNVSEMLMQDTESTAYTYAYTQTHKHTPRVTLYTLCATIENVVMRMHDGALVRALKAYTLRRVQFHKINNKVPAEARWTASMLHKTHCDSSA